jgi:hypothetical protein
MARICEWEHNNDDDTVEIREQPSCGHTLVFEGDHVCDDCSYGPQSGCPDVDLWHTRTNAPNTPC